MAEYVEKGKCLRVFKHRSSKKMEVSEWHMPEFAMQNGSRIPAYLELRIGQKYVNRDMDVKYWPGKVNKHDAQALSDILKYMAAVDAGVPYNDENVDVRVVAKMIEGETPLAPYTPPTTPAVQTVPKQTDFGLADDDIPF